MENTGIGWGKEEFVPRKNDDEFFRDGKVITELYEWTDCLMADQHNLPYGEYTLQVFNHAYRICWMYLGGKGTVKDIDRSIMFENDVVRMYSWTVAYTLFRLNAKFHPFAWRIGMNTALVIPRDFFQKHYWAFAKRKSLSRPIDFRAPFDESEPEAEIDFVRVKEHVTAALDKAIKLDAENRALRRQQREARTESVRDKNLCKELQEQNALLKQQVSKLENDELCKVVNLETIAQYGLRQTNTQIVEVIVNMLNRLCVDKRCVPEPLQKRIEELEEHILALKTPQPITQHNHGCQNFYGNVTDSDFHA